MLRNRHGGLTVFSIQCRAELKSPRDSAEDEDLAGGRPNDRASGFQKYAPGYTRARVFPYNLLIPDRPSIPDTLASNRFVERPCRRRVTEADWNRSSLPGRFATKRIERVPAGDMTRGHVRTLS